MLLNDEWRALLADYRAYHDHPMCEATHVIGIPVVIVSLPTLFLAPALGAGLFVLGWVLQLVGHHIQGNPPKFLGDKRNLLVGAIWWLDLVLRPTRLNRLLFGT